MSGHAMFAFGALLGVVAGISAAVAVALIFFHLGMRVAGDRALDAALDPGERVGQLPSADGEDSADGTGRYRMPANGWPLRDFDTQPTIDMAWAGTHRGIDAAPIGEEARA